MYRLPNIKYPVTYSFNKYMNNIILLRKRQQDKTFTIYIHI